MLLCAFLVALGVAVTPEPELGAPDLEPVAEQTPTATPELGAAVVDQGKPEPVIREEQSGVAVWHPPAIRDGRLLVLEIEAGTECGNPRVRFGGHIYDSFEAGARRQAFIPVRLGASPGVKLFHIICGRRALAFGIHVFAGDYPEARLSVDPRFTAKPPKRVAEESAQISKALASGTAERLWRGTFVRPVTGVITSPFGVRRTFNGKLNSRHRGLDFDGKIGDPIVAVNDGVVVLAAKDYYYTGGAVFLSHGDELFTMYFHMSRLDVATGDTVKRGQLLGAVGASGRVTGPHLHFGFKLHGTYLDPEDLLAYKPPSP